MAKGFLESLFDILITAAAVHDSRDRSGRPDPNKAAGIAYAAKGDLSIQDMAELHDALKVNGAFEEKKTN